MHRSAAALLGLLFLLHGPAGANDSVTEEEVAAGIEAARAELADARRAVREQRARVERRRAEIEAALRRRAEARSLVRLTRRQIESIYNSIDTATAHIDSELAKWQAELESRRENGESPARIAEARRYVRAHENWHDLRLRRLGLDDRLDSLRQTDRETRRLLREMTGFADEKKHAYREAVQRLEDLEAARTAAHLRLADLLALAPEQLKHLAPPYLREVTVADDEGQVVYQAQWISGRERIDDAIGFIRDNIDLLNERLAARRVSIETLSEQLEDANRTADRYLQSYVDMVGNEDDLIPGAGWHTLGRIGIEFTDSMVSVARDWKSLGPYAFVVEAGNRWINAALSGSDYEDHYDIMALPGIGGTAVPRPSPVMQYLESSSQSALVSTLKTTFTKVLEARAVGGFGESLAHTYRLRDVGDMWNKGGMKIYVGEFLETLTYKRPVNLTIPGKTGAEAADFPYARRFRARQSHKWYTDPFPERELRETFGDIKRQLLSMDMLAEISTDVAQSFVAEAAKWGWDQMRLAAWGDYIAADTYRTNVLNALKTEGGMREMDLAAREALEQLLEEALAMRERAELMRDRRLLVNDVLEGRGDFTLELAFSQPVEVTAVALAGQAIEVTGAEESWQGRFDLGGLPEIAPLTVEAHRGLSRQALDDPVTVASYVTDGGKWLRYEPQPDRHHQLKTRPLPPGASFVFLIDASGSMDENGRMQRARAAVREALYSGDLTPEDETAVFTFSDCDQPPRLLVPFTHDRERVMQAVENVEPDGGTPLARGILAAGHYLETTANFEQRSLVILSDGKESCHGDVGAALHRVRQALDSTSFGTAAGSTP